MSLNLLQLISIIIAMIIVIVIASILKNLRLQSKLQSKLQSFEEGFKDNEVNEVNNIKNVKKDFIYPGKDMLDDPLFYDVKTYSNLLTMSPFSTYDETGLLQCFKNCDGVCVEYGVTGNAFCFPK